MSETDERNVEAATSSDPSKKDYGNKDSPLNIQHVGVSSDNPEHDRFIGQGDELIKKVPSGHFGLIEWEKGGAAGRGFISGHRIMMPKPVQQYIFGLGKRKVTRIIPKADQQFSFDVEATSKDNVHFIFSCRISFK